jgi:hypothetical protein
MGLPEARVTARLDRVRGTSVEAKVAKDLGVRAVDSFTRNPAV